MTEKYVSYPWKAYLFGLIMNSSGIIFGFSIGQFNTFFEYLMKGRYPDIPTTDYDNIQSILNSVFNLGGLMCSFTSTAFLNNFERRHLFIGFGIMMIFFSLIQSILPLIGLYIVRCFLGYIVCFNSVLCPVMVTESLPEHYTGSLNSLFYFFLACGAFSAMLFKGSFAQDYYYIVYSIPVFIEIVRMTLFLVIFNFETPRYVYINKSKIYEIEQEMERIDKIDTDQNEALIISDSTKQEHLSEQFAKDKRIQKHLNIFYRKNIHEIQLQKLQNEYYQQIKASLSSQNLLSLAFSEDYKKQTILGLLLNCVNPLSGLNVILLYSTNVFTRLAFSNPEELSIFVNAFLVLGGFINIFSSDRVGRKKLIIIGLVMISISYLSIMTGESFFIPNLILIGNYMYSFSFSMSIGGLLYVYQTEILPGEVIPLVTSTQWFFALVFSYFSLPLIDSVGIYSLYFVFFLASFISWFVFAGMAVESKKKTLSQLKNEFMKKKFWS